MTPHWAFVARAVRAIEEHPQAKVAVVCAQGVKVAALCVRRVKVTAPCARAAIEVVHPFEHVSLGTRFLLKNLPLQLLLWLA